MDENVITENPNEATDARPKPCSDPKLADEHRKQAAIVREFATSSALAGMIKLNKHVTPAGVKTYLDEFCRDANSTDDPVERVMLEQLAFAHHRLAHLHLESSQATDVEAIQIYNAAAARLLSELRRLALAIREYRSPTSGKSSKVEHIVRQEIHQQNVSHGGQEVQYLNAEGGSRATAHESELASNNAPQERFSDAEDRITREKPQARGRRQTQSRIEGAVD